MMKKHCFHVGKHVKLQDVLADRLTIIVGYRSHDRDEKEQTHIHTGLCYRWRSHDRDER